MAEVTLRIDIKDKDVYYDFIKFKKEEELKRNEDALKRLLEIAGYAEKGKIKITYA